MTKKERLLEALTELKSKVEPNTEDMLDFLVRFNNCMKQGGGLMWSDVETILKEVGYK